MKAELKDIISPDIIDIRNFHPQKENCFSFLFEFTVGIKGEECGDQFSIEVCTPNWLLENLSKSEALFGTNRLIVLSYDVDLIINQITQYCSSCTGENWEEIADKISRIARWEFEDYNR